MTVSSKCRGCALDFALGNPFGCHSGRGLRQRPFSAACPETAFAPGPERAVAGRVVISRNSQAPPKTLSEFELHCVLLYRLIWQLTWKYYQGQIRVFLTCESWAGGKKLGFSDNPIFYVMMWIIASIQLVKLLFEASLMILSSRLYVFAWVLISDIIISQCSRIH